MLMILFENMLLIHRIEKLDFYQQHLDMVDLRVERRQSEGLKRFEVTLRMPVGYYYWGCKCSGIDSSIAALKLHANYN
jgi:hypothetical protein